MSDLIKREDAIKAIKLKVRIPHDVVSAQYASMAINAICQVPSADRPQGEWIVSSKDSICPICGKDEAEFICGTEDWYGYGLSNYCPNCGARMKGADDE